MGVMSSLPENQALSLISQYADFLLRNEDISASETADAFDSLTESQKTAFIEAMNGISSLGLFQELSELDGSQELVDAAAARVKQIMDAVLGMDKEQNAAPESEDASGF